MKVFPILFLLAASGLTVSAKEPEERSAAKNQLESPSPDERFAFRFEGGPDDDTKAYVLVERKTGKVLKRVAESDPDPSASSRFLMSVLWAPNSERFAVTETLWKRGSSVAVFVREGASFREVKVPELKVEIPAQVKSGKEYPHVVALDAQSAKRWLQEGSLQVQVETMLDGTEDGTLIADRTVILGLGKGSKAQILQSTTKYRMENEGPPPKLDPLPCTVRLLVVKPGASHAGRPADQAPFKNPAGLVADATGNIYVLDSENATLSRISPRPHYLTSKREELPASLIP